jgi:glycosyltransferase involved in cell wall biosynthesis
MHICFLCNEYPPGAHGGIGTFTRTLARGLVMRGHSATVVGVYDIHEQTTDVDEGVRVVRLPHTRAAGVGFWFNGRRLRAAIRAIHDAAAIDLIEGQENSLAFLSRHFVAPMLIRMHGGHHFFSVTLGRRPRPWRSWVERRSFHRADEICAVSRFVAEQTSRLLHLDPARVAILPNPVDTSMFRPREDVMEDASQVLFVGTIAEKKGVRQLIEAMPEVIAAVPGAHLTLIGRDTVDEHTGGSYRDTVSRLIPEGTRDRIEFSGLVQNDMLPLALAKAAVCVYPSHMEAMPLAPLEAMAAGRAVIVSSAGPGPEVIDDGESGLLCNPHDPQSISSQIITLLRDPALRRRLGEAARRRALERFSIDRLIERNIEWYRHCATGRAAVRQ